MSRVRGRFTGDKLATPVERRKERRTERQTIKERERERERETDLEVGRRAGQRLDVDAPEFRVEIEGRERAVAAEALRGVDVLVAAVVALAGISLGVLVAPVCSRPMNSPSIGFKKKKKGEKERRGEACELTGSEWGGGII